MNTKSKYTEQQIAEMTTKYENGVEVATIAADMGLSTRQVIAKLTNLKVYVSKASKTAQDKTPNQTKGDVVAMIAATLQLPVEQLKGLDTVAKYTLEHLLKNILKYA